MVHHGFGSARIGGIVAATLALMAMCLPLQAQELPQTRQSFDIPAQNIADALNEFSKQSGLRLLFNFDAVPGQQISAIKGDFPPGEVLTKILAGTGLRYDVTSDSVVVIKQGENSTTSGAAGTAATTSQAGTSETATTTAGLAEVLVTAQKRTESLMNVPVAVSSVSSDVLSDRNQIQLQDYYTSIPGLSINQLGNGFTTLAIRGVITGFGTNPTVGVVIDDVPVGASTLLGLGARLTPDLDPASLSRVEVLRGPQGTLYGASSMGGLLKYQTRDPSTADFEGRVELSGNSIDGGDTGYGARAVVNVPLSDTVAMTAGGFYRHDAGYVDNTATGEDDVNDADVSGGNIALLLQPNDVLDLKFSVLYQQTDANGIGAVDTDFQLKPVNNDLTQSFIPFAGEFTKEIAFYSVVADVDLGNMTLSSLTGYSDSKYETADDFTPSLGFLAELFYGPDNGFVVRQTEVSTTKFTQELRLASNGNGSFDWLVGAFYTDEDAAMDPDQIVALNEATGETVATLLAGPSQSTFEELAGFANLTFHFSDTLSAQLGGRYASIDQDFVENDSGDLLPGPSTITAETSTSATTFLASLAKRFEESMIYGRIASGYRAGGPNPGAVLGFPLSYDPDETINYEVGLKRFAFDRRLSIDAALYYIDWDDIQLVNRDPDTGFQYYENGGKAKSQGVELALNAEPSEGLLLGLSAAYNIAELSEDLPPTSSVGVDGDRLPAGAEFSGSLSADQEISLSNSTLSFGGTYSYVGSRKGDFPTEGSIRLEFPSYNRLDLRAGVSFDQWSIRLFVNNVTDELGVMGGRPLDSLGPSTVDVPYTAYFLQPRTYELSVRYDF